MDIMICLYCSLWLTKLYTRTFSIIGPKMDKIWAWGGRFGSTPPSKVWSRVLVFWQLLSLKKVSAKSKLQIVITYRRQNENIFMNSGFFGIILGGTLEGAKSLLLRQQDFWLFQTTFPPSVSICQPSCRTLTLL